MNTDTTAKNPSQALGDSSRLCAFGVNFLEFRQRKMLPWDKLREECGIFGIVSHAEAARLAYLGIYALQHRGQESAGVVSSDGNKLYLQQGMGHVAEVFNEERLEKLPGTHAIGHVRYSTAGESALANAQPIL